MCAQSGGVSAESLSAADYSPRSQGRVCSLLRLQYPQITSWVPLNYRDAVKHTPCLRQLTPTQQKAPSVISFTALQEITLHNSTHTLLCTRTHALTHAHKRTCARTLSCLSKLERKGEDGYVLDFLGYI